jgi:cation transport ATPase
VTHLFLSFSLLSYTIILLSVLSFLKFDALSLSHDFFCLDLHYVACRGSVYRALGLMVAASPCALAVAPLAYATAISSCARKVSVN